MINAISDEFLFGEKIDMDKFKEKMVKDGNEDQLNFFFAHKARKTDKNGLKSKPTFVGNDRPCVITKQKPPADPLTANLNYYTKTNPQVAKIEKLTMREKEALNMKKRRLLEEYRQTALDEFNAEKNQSIMLSQEANQIRNDIMVNFKFEHLKRSKLRE